MHPELGYREVRTSAIVARELEALGLEVQRGIARTGVVALLEGVKPGPVILLRFDMDALPIQEESGAEYASQTPGVMHACGHDGHTAIGLTVARLLHAHRQELAGTIKFVFQPAEEGLCGEEMGGAEMMIAEGVLEDPRPDFALALHLWNEQPAGWLGIAAGPVMAGAEWFQVRIHGKGGHGAVPHLAIDPILAGAQVVSALQSIVSRNVPPLQSAVVSVTMFHAGDAFNVIPQVAHLEGTIRTFDLQVREKVLKRFAEIIQGVSQAMGCQAEINLKRVTPALINEAGVAYQVQQVARQLFPQATLDSQPYVTMGAEDMGFILERIPGCYFFVGSANPSQGLNYPHHHPRFDFEESVLPQAVALISAAALRLGKSKAP
uniref:M20D family peptidase n=1 Tax=uncultured Chloroflexota bacterium TaxID=166587 RepID=H5SFN6_9CHLR|nr:M20D family peptidase [uncultured Chloroflexota bacterium]